MRASSNENAAFKGLFYDLIMGGRGLLDASRACKNAAFEGLLASELLVCGPVMINGADINILLRGCLRE